jgi:hypothetical protein
MAPVQKIYSEPSGLLGSKAHMDNQTITQSMCRVVLPDGKEQSACVACQNPCIDIDAERAYWDGLKKKEESFLRYGYIGLVVGYFVYYYLYAGNWDYYFSGAWARNTNQLGSLFKPGFYLFGQTINVPKLFAVPLTLAAFTAFGYWLGKYIEKQLTAKNRKRFTNLTPEIIKHRIFSICTFGIFNFFFIFGGRPLIKMLPIWLEYTYDLGLVALSMLWLTKTWYRSYDMYSREKLASHFRKQLEKLQLDISQFMEGRSLGDLNIDEVYVLAKVLPGFTRDKRDEAYKGVLKEALEEGYVNYSTSLEILQQMRKELGITDDEHREVLSELGIEDPELINSNRQRNLENQIRLSGYRKSLERLMLLQNKQLDDQSFDELQKQSVEFKALQQQYSITPQEEAWILSGLSKEAGVVRRALFLLKQLPNLIACHRALNQPILPEQRAAVIMLQQSVSHKIELIVRSFLKILETLNNDPAGITLAQSLARQAPSSLLEVLESENWRQRLNPAILQHLTQPGEKPLTRSIDSSTEEVIGYLEALLNDQNPSIQAVSLYIIAQLNPERGKEEAKKRQNEQNSPLLKETASILLKLSHPHPALTEFPKLEKLVHLFNSDFFQKNNLT